MHIIILYTRQSNANSKAKANLHTSGTINAIKTGNAAKCGHISQSQIKYKEHHNNHIHKNWSSTGKFERTSGFSAVT